MYNEIEKKKIYKIKFICDLVCAQFKLIGF
jgi:hypothetical protein